MLGRVGDIAFQVRHIKHVSRSHDEVIFITVSEQWVIGGNTVEVVFECRCHLGQIHVVDVDEVEMMSEPVSSRIPFVVPAYTRYDPHVLGSLLVVDIDGEIGGGSHTSQE